MRSSSRIAELGRIALVMSVLGCGAAACSEDGERASSAPVGGPGSDAGSSDGDAGRGDDLDAGQGAAETGARDVLTISFACTTAEAGAGAIAQDLGHQGTVRRIWRSGDRVLSAENAGWILWDATTGLEIASSLTGTVHAMAAGSFYVIDGATPSVDVRSLADGTKTSTLPVGPLVLAEWGVAEDGSYFWKYEGNTLAIRSPSGTLLATRTGTYAPFAIAAKAGVLHVPTTTNMLEHVRVDGSPVTTSPPFEGTFQGWSDDRTRFVTKAAAADLGTVAVVYDAQAMELQRFALSPAVSRFAAQRDYFWRRVLDGSATDTIEIFRVSEGEAPVATVVIPHAATLQWAGDVLAAFEASAFSSATMTIVRLGDVVTQATRPIGLPAQALAVDADGRWAMGGEDGFVVSHGDSTAADHELVLGCGAVRLATARNAGKMAIGTNQDRVAVVDVPSGVAQADIALDTRWIALSTGADVLATSDANGDIALRALPSGAVTTVVAPGTCGPHGKPVVLAENAARAGWYHEGADGRVVCVVDVATAKATQTVLGERAYSNPFFTPDARRFVVGSTTVGAMPQGTYWMTFFEGGASKETIQGARAIGWIDGDHFLYRRIVGTQPGGVGSPVFADACTAASAGGAGAWDTTCPLDESHGVIPIDASKFFADRVIETATGKVLYTPPAGVRGVAGPFLVGINGRTLFAVAH